MLVFHITHSETLTKHLSRETGWRHVCSKYLIQTKTLSKPQNSAWKWIPYSIISQRSVSCNYSAAHIRLVYRQAAERMDSLSVTNVSIYCSKNKALSTRRVTMACFASLRNRATHRTSPPLAFVIIPLLFKSILLHALHTHPANTLLFLYVIKFRRWEIWSQWK